MTHQVARVAVLGSTGSIGRNTLEVIGHAPETLSVVALSAHNSLDMLVEQAHKHAPRWIVAADSLTAATHDWTHLPGETELLVGPEGLENVASRAEVDVVVSAIVGSAGLRSTWAALEAGKTVALANKETMVVAGPPDDANWRTARAPASYRSIANTARCSNRCRPVGATK